MDQRSATLAWTSTTSAVSPAQLDALSERVATAGTETIDVSAPAMDEPLGSIPACSEADVKRAVRRAQQARSAWATRSVADRVAVIDRFADLVLERRTMLLDLLQLETGKARRTAAEELLDVPLNCSYYRSIGPEAVASEKRRGALPGATSARVSYDPVGVVGLISPWNYPLALAVADAIPALIAGNAVVLKPDEKTPFVALALATLFAEAGGPKGVFEVVTGEGDVVGPALIDYIDHIAFTGSTETGRAVAERAGHNLIDCSLELGGNNPLVVLDDADVETAACGALQACFSNAGQLCLAAERIYVDESLYEPFRDAFVDATRGLTVGTDLDYESDVGSLIDGAQLNRVEDHVAEAIETGATVLTGGQRRPDVGPLCYEPTVLADVDPDATVACEETFGPVVSLTPVPDEAAAIEAANDSPYGLNASVWTGSRDRGRRVADRIESGTVCVNDGYIAGWAAVDGPMGGVGDSGLGRRHGPEGIARYLEPRLIGTSRVGPLGVPSGAGSASKWLFEGMFRALGAGQRLRQWVR